MTRFLWIFVGILSLFSQGLFSNIQDTIQCRGKIRAFSKSKSSVSNLSNITMNVYSEEGELKERMKCMPNGFYFLQVSEKRTFILRPESPNNLEFNPKSITIYSDINNYTEVCKDAEFDFELSGLTIKGIVQSLYSDKGPKNVSIRLFDNENKAKYLVENYTEEGGNFQFDNLYPGNYSISISHSFPQQDFQYSTYDCIINWKYEHSCHDIKLFVVGYKFSGILKNPLTNVKIIFLSKNEKIPKITHFLSKQIEGFHPVLIKNIEGSGNFTIENVNFGEYILQFEHTESKSFEIQPQEISINIGHKDYVMETPIEIIKFSLSGRVKNSKLIGISNVFIYLNGEKVTETDVNGGYRISFKKPDKYKIEAKKTDFQFREINTFVDASMTSIPDIFVEKVNACGKLVIEDQSRVISIQNTEIQFKNEDNKAISDTMADAQGRFCLFIFPGTYTIQPSTIISEGNEIITISPNKITKTVLMPDFNINFYQQKLDLIGKITFKDTQIHNIGIMLKSAKGSIISNNISENNEFTFSKILPGAYILSIDENEFCWEKSSLYINHNFESGKPVFVQNGINLKYTSKIQSHFQFDFPENITNKYEINIGDGHICIPSKNILSVTPHDCYKYEKNALKINFESTPNLNINPQLIKMNGILKVTDEYSSIEDFSKSVKIEISDTQNNLTNIINLKRESPISYTFQFEAQIDSSIFIIPTKEKFTQLSNNYTFHPRNIQIKVERLCEIKQTIEIKVVKGKLIEGKVDPPVEEVLIKLIDNTDGTYSSDVFTDANGSYSVGPVYFDHDYKLSASKKGYKFYLSDDDQTTFISEQMSQLNVVIKTSEEFKGVSNAYIYISRVTGDQGAPLTRITNDQGIANFMEISPGEYFIDAQLKEYEITPNQEKIKLVSGETLNFEMNATKVEYSIIGKILELTNSGAKNVLIEAICITCGSSKQIRKTTISESSGYFRLMGLTSFHTYRVSIKLESGKKYAAFSPKFIEVTIEKQDIMNMQFYVLGWSNETSISGIINFEGENINEMKDRPNLEVRLLENKEIINKIPDLNGMNYFRFHNLGMKTYSIMVLCKGNEPKYENLALNVSLTNEYLKEHLNKGEISLNLTLKKIEKDNLVNRKSRYDILVILGIILIASIVYYLTQKKDKIEPKESRKKNSDKKNN